MIAEPLVYIPKLDPAGIGTCPVSSRRNGTREYDDIIFFRHCGSRRATEERVVAHFQSRRLKTKFES
jgi:hypothetical protein